MQNVETSHPVDLPSKQSGPEVTTPTQPTAFEDWLQRARDEVEHAIAAHFAELESTFEPHSRLLEAVQYSVNVGGKRLRPILVLETCRVCGGRAQTAMPAALAMEFIHTFSLIHDDLPAMDNDDLRRGKPTNHKVFGEGLAVLAGDWLVTHAFATLATDRYARGACMGLFQALADGTKRMIEGQGADIEGEQRPPEAALVNFIHRHKTAALLETCCRLGALCARASDAVAAALARYGRHLGLAFQIQDDLLDAQGDEAHLGKRVNKDAEVSKQTYPAVYGFDASTSQAAREVDAALLALEPFGGRAARLRDLAQFVIQRDH